MVICCVAEIFQSLSGSAKALVGGGGEDDIDDAGVDDKEEGEVLDKSNRLFLVRGTSRISVFEDLSRTEV